jgi:hypothetical protein
MFPSKEENVTGWMKLHDEYCGLMGCDTIYSDIKGPTFRRNLLPPSSWQKGASSTSLLNVGTYLPNNMASHIPEDRNSPP